MSQGWDCRLRSVLSRAGLLAASMVRRAVNIRPAFLSRSERASNAAVRRFPRPDGYLVYLAEAAGPFPSGMGNFSCGSPAACLPCCSTTAALPAVTDPLGEPVYGAKGAAPARAYFLQ